MEKDEIVYIPADQIYPHPDNPRKDLGDLTELTESIRKKGVLQNLTVIPGHWNDKGKWLEDDFTIIIGHRRCAAGKLAGVSEFLCDIKKNMSKKDQISTMLEENMQRNDLTIYEQAQGFQMMLDLGESEDQIAEKTGFSKATIKHRLNIAKLDQKELKKKEQDESFQLTLKDLYELEKVRDIKIRNKILKESNNSRDIVSRSQSAVSEANRAENAKIIKGIIKKLGIEKAPDGVENEMYSGKWKTVKEFDLEKDAPKRIKLPEEKEQMYWIVWYRTFRVIVKASKEKRELSKWELEQKERDSAKRKIKSILKESTSRRKEFILNIISGNIDPVKNESETKNAIWAALVALEGCIYKSTLSGFFLGQDYYKSTEEEREDAKEKSEALSILHQMMVALHSAMKNKDELVNYQGEFIKERADALLKGYAALEPFGWYFENEAEKSVLDGTHESYKESEQKKGNS